MQSIMFDRATLGGVSGVAMVWVRRGVGEATHRGSFWFRAEQDAEVRRLVEAQKPIEFTGWIDGERRRLTTRLTSADSGSGLAMFEGLGEPVLVAEPRRGVGPGAA
jgi:hypothetical protein